MAQQFPQKFGPYTLHELIARGGMAEVYRATMPGIGGFEKTVAIKKILPHLAENEEFIVMLKDEANIIVSINHSNIAQVYDLGKIEDTYYIAMEYVHGIDVSTILKIMAKQGRYLPLDHAIYICSCICAGLHTAHAKCDDNGNPLNIVHRDVSPHNVLLSFAGDVKVIDFGVAKASVKDSHTKMGVIKGKLLYMAPEQAMAKEIDGRADIFAVGLILYKMLTHHLPFEGDNEFQIYNNIINKDIAPPKAFNEAIPDDLNAVVMKFLERDPETRYQDGYEAKHDLDRILHRISPGYTINRLSRFLEDNFSSLSTPQAPSNSAAKEEDLPPIEIEEVIPEPLDVEDSEPVADETLDTVHMAMPFAPGTFDPNSLRTKPSSPNQTGSQDHDSTIDTAITNELTSPGFVPKLPAPKPQKQRQTQQKTVVPKITVPSVTPATITKTTKNKRQETNNAADATKAKKPVAIYAVIAMVVVIGALIALNLVNKGTSSDPYGDLETIPLQPEVPTNSRIAFRLTSDPEGAELFRGDNFVGTTPVTLSLPYSEDPIDFYVEAPGFESQSLELAPTKDITVNVILDRIDAPNDPPAETNDTNNDRPTKQAPTPSQNTNKQPQNIRRQPQMLDIRTAPSALSGRSTRDSRSNSNDDESNEE